MRSKFVSRIVRFGVRRGLAVVVLLVLAGAVSASVIPNLLPFLDPTGFISTFNTAGKIDTNEKNPFFENLGTNGRNCGTCHIAANAMGLSTDNVQERFHRSSRTSTERSYDRYHNGSNNNLCVSAAFANDESSFSEHHHV